MNTYNTLSSVNALPQVLKHSNTQSQTHMLLNANMDAFPFSCVYMVDISFYQHNLMISRSTKPSFLRCLLWSVFTLRRKKLFQRFCAETQKSFPWAYL